MTVALDVLMRCNFPIGVVVLALVGCADVDEHLGVVYDARHGVRTTMDFYTPAASDDTARPAVMLIHGGGWRQGSKEGMRDPALRLATAGYVTASINYRLTPEIAFPDNIQDVMCAFAFFRAQADEFGFDPDRVAVMGYSAGGHLASLLGVATDVAEFAPDCDAGAPAPPNAVISGAGPQDMRNLREHPAVTDFLGGTADEVPEIYDIASPVHHVDAGEPPFLFIHGTHDLFVPYEDSEIMRDLLRARGNQARVLGLDAGGHLLNTGPSEGHADVLISTATTESWAALIDFLDQTLGAP